MKSLQELILEKINDREKERDLSLDNGGIISGKKYTQNIHIFGLKMSF